MPRPVYDRQGTEVGQFENNRLEFAADRNDWIVIDKKIGEETEHGRFDEKGLFEQKSIIKIRGRIEYTIGFPIAYKITDEDRISDKLYGKFRNPEAKNAILFVHGIRSSWDSAWLNEDTGTSFLDLAWNSSELSEFDVLAFDYQSTVFRGSRIADVATQLRDTIRLNIPDRRIVLIAHSMGGLISMQCILDYLTQPRADDPIRISALMMYATPTTGSAWANVVRALPAATGIIPKVGSFFRSIGNFVLGKNDQIKDLAIGSEFLEELHGKWIKHAANGGDSAAEPDATRRAYLPIRVVAGNDDWVVTRASAKGIYGEIDWRGLDEGHNSVCKPPNETDDRFKLAEEFAKTSLSWPSTDVLNHLNATSDQILGLRNSIQISDWRYQVSMNSPNDDVPDYLAGTFTPFQVHECKYKFRLRSRTLRFCIANGHDTVEAAWEDFDPIYVHGLIPVAAEETEIRRINQCIDQLISAQDLVPVWGELFPEFELRLRNTTGVEIALDQNLRIHRPGNRMLAIYERSIADPSVRVGDEVELDLSFKSFGPSAINIFQVYFQWLTKGCNVSFTRLGEVHYVTKSPRAFGNVKFDADARKLGDRIEGKVRTGDRDNIFLPKSAVVFRWEPKSEQEETI